MRLVSHEIACVGTYQFFEKYSSHDDNNLTKEVTAGAISGLCQALIFCQLELHRANQLKRTEEKERTSRSFKYWIKWTKSQLLERGTGDPQERWKKAYRGVGTLAARCYLIFRFFQCFMGWSDFLIHRFFGEMVMVHGVRHSIMIDRKMLLTLSLVAFCLD